MHAQATDHGDDVLEQLDLDLKEEEMALAGKRVNPLGIDYKCVAWPPISDNSLASTFGFHPPLPRCALYRASLHCTQGRATAALTR